VATVDSGSFDKTLEIQLQRKFITKKTTGEELLKALSQASLHGRVPFVPRKLEERAWRRGASAVVSLANPKGASQVFCIAIKDKSCVIRNYVDITAAIPEGATLFALRG
jgi:hypothetical protein